MDHSIDTAAFVPPCVFSGACSHVTRHEHLCAAAGRLRRAARASGCGTPTASAISTRWPASRCAVSATATRATSPRCASRSGSLVHTSNLYEIPLQEQLADRLAAISGMDNVFFCNSGCEANEAAIKLARLYGHNEGHRVARDRGDGKGVPRPHHCDAFGDGQPQGAGRFRAAGRGLRAGAVRRPRGGEARGRGQSQRGGGAGRAAAGRRRRQRLPRRLPARPARDLRGARVAAHAGRGAKRHGPHRQVVRVPAFGRDARRDAARQGTRQRRADRGVPRGGARGRLVQARQPRLHFRRQPARLRGGARHARHHRGRAADGERGRRRRASSARSWRGGSRGRKE